VRTASEREPWVTLLLLLSLEYTGELVGSSGGGAVAALFSIVNSMAIGPML